MITAICCAVAVLAAGAALRPTPPVRRPGDDEPRPHELEVGRHVPHLRISRRPTIAADDVAVWCEQLARAVRAGETLTSAIRSTTPPTTLATTVDGIRLRLERGTRLSDAVAGSSPSPHLDLALAVLRACAINGGAAAEPLDRAAATLRARAADQADRATHSAQARSSAVVMTLLPVAMLLLLVATSSATRAAVQTPAGVLTVGSGVVLNLAGWRWMRRVIDGGVR